MPTRPNIPVPGTPLAPPGHPAALGQVLADIAYSAGRQDDLQHGITAREGTLSSPSPQVSIALFKLTGRWTSAALPAGQSWPFMPSLAAWYYAPATRVEYYPAAGTWNTPADEGDDATTPETGYVWHQAGMQLESVDPARGLPASLEAAGDFMPAAGPGQWVWCFYDEGPGCWVVLQPCEDIVRVKLSEDLYACGSAAAAIWLAASDITSGGGGFYTTSALTVYDVIGIVGNSLAAQQDSSGNYYIPAGTRCYVKRFADDNAWEPLAFGSATCSGSSGSGSSSGISGSGSSGE